MKQYSSTTIRYFSEHCPAALGFYEQGYQDESDTYQPGVAAHAVLQEVGEKKSAELDKIQAIGDAVAQRLITNGRFYYSELKPPMKPEFAFAGRDIALQYLRDNRLPENGKFEIVLAMDSKGKSCPNGKHRWRAIIDCVYEDTEGDEDFSADLVVVRDYKSAWPTDESELDTLQRKGQGVLAWIHYPSKAGVRMEVVNLRTAKVYSRTIYFDDEGIALLKQWRKDILSLCNAADKTRKARPGSGCIDCPFLEHCSVAQKVADSKTNVSALAVLEAKRKVLRAKLKVQLADHAGVKIDGGFIGYKNQSENVLSQDALKQVLADWYNVPLHSVSDERGAEVALLMTLGIGSGQIKSYAKSRFTGEHKTVRQEFEQLCLQKSSMIEFGVWKEKDANGMKLVKKSDLKKKKPSKKIKKAA